MSGSLVHDNCKDGAIYPSDNSKQSEFEEIPMIDSSEDETVPDKTNNLNTYCHIMASANSITAENTLQFEHLKQACNDNDSVHETNEVLQTQQEQNNSNINLDNSLEDVIITDCNDESYLDIDQNLHTNLDMSHGEMVHDVKAVKDETNSDEKHMSDSGIDMTYSEVERPQGIQMHNSAAHGSNEVIYDETAPRRIPRPNKLKLQSPNQNMKILQDGIDKLIAPDENELAQSPNRMRRVASVKSPHYDSPPIGRPIVVYDEPEDDISSEARNVHNGGNQYHQKRKSEPPRQMMMNGSNTLQVDQPHEHYRKSPETRRRLLSANLETTKRCESPVLRLKNRSSETSPSLYKKYGRKISSDARLSGGSPGSSFTGKPIRKISSNARLEHVTECVDNIPNEDSKSRRVSFGTATYLGRATQTRHRAVNDSDVGNVKDARQELTNEVQKAADTRSQVVDKQLDSSNYDEQSQANLHKCVENENGSVHHGGNEDNYRVNETIGHYNKAYVDDERDLKSSAQLKIIDMQTGTPMSVKKKMPSKIKECSSSESLISFEATKSLSQIHKPKKISTQSLPSVHNNELLKTKTRHSVGIVDSPKSILKIKKEEQVSNGSTESINEKRYKIKRDSVALYHAQQGDEEKPHLGSWVGISRKDFKKIWDSRYDLLARYKIHLAVFIIFIVTIIFVIVGVKLHKPQRAVTSSQATVILDPDFRRIHLFDDEELDAVSGILGIEIPEKVPASNCYLNFEAEAEVKCLSWEEYAELTIVHKVYNKTQCYDIRWILNPGVRLTDCYDTKSAHWYGPVNSSEAVQWPLKGTSFSFDSLIPSATGTFSKVIDYLWLSSNGVAVTIDPDFPVYMSWNENSGDTLCISRSKQESSYPNVLNTNRQVRYSICNGVNILETYKFVRNNFFPKLTQLPEFSLLLSPHWASSIGGGSFIANDSVVFDLAKQITDHKLNCSLIEISGRWEAKYGDFTFDQSAFMDINSILENLTAAGCGLSVKVYPYVNYLSENFRIGLVNEYFVKSSGGSAPALLQWQYGIGSMVDVTGTDSRDWFSSKLRNLRTFFSVTTFRFGYGNSLWLPSNVDFNTRSLLPNDVLKVFSTFIGTFGPTILERTSQTQNVPTLLSIRSEIIEIKERKCLKNVIPEALTLGMLGYPFLILDGIDLTRMKDTADLELPSQDLFIRWMQLASFFPAMKYTIKPWQYGEDMIIISKNLTRFHQDTVVDIIFSLQRLISSGEPIFRPIWWTDPKDEIAFSIDDQFLLGDDMIVAPVLCEGISGETERQVYIPKGIWRDSLSKALIPGPKTIPYYKVKQNQIAIFTREILFDHV